MAPVLPIMILNPKRSLNCLAFIFHSLMKINQSIPKKGRYYLKFNPRKLPQNGTPVFLTDRREQALQQKIDALDRRLQEVSIPAPKKEAITMSRR